MTWVDAKQCFEGCSYELFWTWSTKSMVEWCVLARDQIRRWWWWWWWWWCWWSCESWYSWWSYNLDTLVNLDTWCFWWSLSWDMWCPDFVWSWFELQKGIPSRLHDMVISASIQLNYIHPEADRMDILQFQLFLLFLESFSWKRAYFSNKFGFYQLQHGYFSSGCEATGKQLCLRGVIWGMTSNKLHSSM